MEYWTARELGASLGYKEYRDIEAVVDKAILVCKNTGGVAAHHFAHVPEMVEIGSDATRPRKNVWMDRYGCYLFALSADSGMPLVGVAKTYFAIQTRRQEVADGQQLLSEDDQRVMLRGEIAKHNKELSTAAKNAGVIESKDFAIFKNFGYKGLYDENMQEIHKRKGLKSSQAILDHMGSTELAANLFVATQTKEKMKREHTKGKDKANQAHFDVGRKVRKTMEETGGTLPEDLPTPKVSVKKLEAAQRKRLKKAGDDQISPTS